MKHARKRLATNRIAGLLRLFVLIVVSASVSALALTRRDLLWKVPVGAIGTYAYGRLVYNGLFKTDIEYPEAHERRVASTIAQSMLLAGVRPSSSSVSTQRVLEVGIGKDCRLLRRGLYQPGLDSLRDRGSIGRVEITGVDLRPPEEEALENARRLVTAANVNDSNNNIQVDVQAKMGSITAKLDYPDGYFDCIVSCLTLCSVDDQRSALQEIRRLLRPNGGTFGYVEHVAVNPAEPYRFLEFQQTTLDPLQQLLADNCHLHRFTEQNIAEAFAPSEAVQKQHERFLVHSMWPVTCQCCGVYQRIT